MPCRSLLLALALALPALSAQAQSAAPKADPAADLTAMQQRAAADPRLRIMLESVLRGTGQTARERFTRLLNYGTYSLRDGITRPIGVDTPEQLRRAQVRASVVQTIMAADLNGDWQVSTTEIRSALSVKPLRGAAEALLLYDTDGNGILTTDEIRKAAEAKADRSQTTRSNPLVLLDFNGDGTVTPEEYQRALAAIPS